MKLYVSGPMSGLPDWNYPAFFKAAQQIGDAGFEPINPARIRDDLPATGAAWVDYMRAALRDVADCDGIALLPGWRDSRGARLEAHIATELDLPVQSVDEWINGGDQ